MSFAITTAQAIALAGALGTAGVVGGALISANSNGGAPGIEDLYTPGPGYGTSSGIENTWANFLNSANAGNNYNAISPDWNDIWNQTQQQVQNYFTGTATTPGVNDQIKASAAQRGVSGGPAQDYLLAASGANQAQTSGNLSAQENIAKNAFGLEGEQTWLNSLNQFQSAPGNVQAEGNWSGGVPYATSGQQVGNAVSAAGTGVAGLAGQQISNQAQLAYLNSILNPTSTGGYSVQTGPDNTFSNTSPLSLPSFA